MVICRVQRKLLFAKGICSCRCTNKQGEQFQQIIRTQERSLCREKPNWNAWLLFHY